MNTPMQQSAADWLVGTFKRNPEGMLLLAAGAVLLLRQGIGTETAGSTTTSKLSEAAVGIKDYAADVTDRTVASASAAASTASNLASDATRKVTEQSERVVQQAQSTLQDTINRVVKDQPLLVAVAGLAAGAVIASTFRTTELEGQTLGPIRAEVGEAAARLGTQLKEATATAGDTLKKAADERGLNAEGLKEVASDVANAFKDRMSGEAKQGATHETGSSGGGRNSE